MKKLCDWLLNIFARKHECDSFGYFGGEICARCGKNRFTGEFRKFGDSSHFSRAMIYFSGGSLMLDSPQATMWNPKGE
jgi:hypothetical protein